MLIISDEANLEEFNDFMTAHEKLDFPEHFIKLNDIYDHKPKLFNVSLKRCLPTSNSVIPFTIHHIPRKEMDDIKKTKETLMLNNSDLRINLHSKSIGKFNSFTKGSVHVLEALQFKKNSENLVFSYGKVTNKKVCCSCKKSHCIKLYCECFAKKRLCNGCKCQGCKNTLRDNSIRQSAISFVECRNQEAFEPKIVKELEKEKIHHARGCNCKKTGCLKKYCECFQSGAICTKLCRCDDCLNNVEKESACVLSTEADYKVKLISKFCDFEPPCKFDLNPKEEKKPLYL